MLQNKFQPGHYLLNNTAIFELGIKDGNSYVINLLFADPNIRLALNSAGTVIAFKKFEQLINDSGKELTPVDPTKAEVISLIYGQGV